MFSLVLFLLPLCRILDEKYLNEKKNRDKMSEEEIVEASRGWMKAFEDYVNLKVR